MTKEQKEELLYLILMYGSDRENNGEYPCSGNSDACQDSWKAIEKFLVNL